jgi:hypothetical protein
MDAFLKDRLTLNPTHTQDTMDADAPFKCLDLEELLGPTNGEASETLYESDPMTDDTMRDDPHINCNKPSEIGTTSSNTAKRKNVSVTSGLADITEKG